MAIDTGRLHTFSDALEVLSDGELNARGSTLLREIAAAVDANGGKGVLTLKITITRTKGGIVTMRPALSATKPEPALDQTVLYIDADSNLTRQDPRQATLPRVQMAPPRVVPMGPGKKPDPEEG